MRASPFLKYRKSFTTGLKASVEYRFNFFLSLAGAVSQVVIQTALWIVLYEGGGEENVLFGFTFTQMIAWTVIAQLVSRLVRTGFEYEVNSDIKSGSLDRYLVKPVSYFGYRLFSFLGDKAAQSLFSCVLLAAAVAVLGTVTGFAVTGRNAALFSVALVLAFVLNFLLFWCVGLAGFWLTEIGFFVRGGQDRDHSGLGRDFSAFRVWAGRRAHSVASAVPLYDPVPGRSPCRADTRIFDSPAVRSGGILDCRADDHGSVCMEAWHQTVRRGGELICGELICGELI